MEFDLVVKNGTIVTSTETIKADVGVEGTRIAAIGERLSGRNVVDARGKLVTPGGVDMHVHLEMNAGKYVSSDDFFEGTKAAAFGGTTTVVDFVEPETDETLIGALEKRRKSADSKVVIDYSLHMTIGPSEIKKLDQLQSVIDAGVRGFKLYMAYNFRLHDGELLEALDAIRKVEGLPIIHAENWDIIQSLANTNIDKGRTEPHWHPVCRPAVFEAEAVNRVIAIAEYVGVPVHIFHVSCREAAEKIEEARERGAAVTGETCPQYLFLDQSLYRRPGVEGSLPVCAPPLRSTEDQKFLWRALRRGSLQTMGSDHCPFTKTEKQAGMSRFDTIPGGVPSIEMRFPSLFTGGVGSGYLSLPQWVNLCCTAPAKLLGLRQKGDIAVGYDADLVVFDPEKDVVLNPDTLHETAGWTPYDGLKLKGWPETVISGGTTIVRKGELTGKPGQGRFIR